MPDLKTYFRAIIIKTAQSLHKNWHIDQHIGIPKINYYIYNQLNLNKDIKNTLEKGQSLSTSGNMKTGFSEADWTFTTISQLKMN
jgi:hypothetical protein